MAFSPAVLKDCRTNFTQKCDMRFKHDIIDFENDNAYQLPYNCVCYFCTYGNVFIIFVFAFYLATCVLIQKTVFI